MVERLVGVYLAHRTPRRALHRHRRTHRRRAFKAAAFPESRWRHDRAHPLRRTPRRRRRRRLHAGARARRAASEGDVIVPAADWIAHGDTSRAACRPHRRLARSGRRPAILKDHLAGLALIAIDFPKFTDGRGYSIGALLRCHGWTGELRAVGEVLRDQLFYLARPASTPSPSRPAATPRRRRGPSRISASPYQDASDSRTRRSPTAWRQRAGEDRAHAQTARPHRRRPSRRAAFASSLSAEDMVLTDLIARTGLPIRIFTLDTGRLHAETRGMIGETKTRYGIGSRSCAPSRPRSKPMSPPRRARLLREPGAAQGLLLHPQGGAAQPRAHRRSAWLTGQRRDQAVTRGALPEEEIDTARGIAEVQSARRLALGGRARLRRPLRCAAQSAARAAIPRSAASHASRAHPPRRGPARRTLVVGAGGQEGMRTARAAIRPVVGKRGMSAPIKSSPRLSHSTGWESEAIHIIREAAGERTRLACSSRAARSGHRSSSGAQGVLAGEAAFSLLHVDTVAQFPRGSGSSATPKRAVTASG